MILRQLEKGDASAIAEFWLGMEIDDLSFRVDGTAIHDDGEVVGFPLDQHGAALNLHATEAEI